MKHIEGNFKSVRQIDVFYQGWLPDGKIRGVILLVHGLGEHSGRYMNIVNHFVPLGYAIYGFDNIGHGKSGGGREQIESFDDLIAPLETYYTMVKSWQPEKPLFILGHSLGGLIECYYLLDHQQDFDGAIISAPSITIGEGITQTTIVLAKILSAIAPKAGVMMLDPNLISRDPEVVSAYANDPLVHHNKVPARMGAEMLRALLRVNAEIGKISIPFIGVHGSKDVLANPMAVKLLEEKTKSKDRTIKLYDGLYHEVFNEPEKAMVLKDVEIWLSTRT